MYSRTLINVINVINVIITFTGAMTFVFRKRRREQHHTLTWNCTPAKTAQQETRRTKRNCGQILLLWVLGHCLLPMGLGSLLSFWEATHPHEYQLAAKLNVTQGGPVLDSTRRGLWHWHSRTCVQQCTLHFMSCKVTGVTLNHARTPIKSIVG
jgi:hypothetical protein